MTPKERATLLRRGYRAGYHAALRKCRAELDVMAANFDADIARLQDKARADRRAMVANFDAEIAKLQDEARKELHSFRDDQSLTLHHWLASN